MVVGIGGKFSIGGRSVTFLFFRKFFTDGCGCKIFIGQMVRSNRFCNKIDHHPFINSIFIWLAYYEVLVTYPIQEFRKRFKQTSWNILKCLLIGNRFLLGSK